MEEIPAPYPFSSFFIGIIIYLYYEFFGMMIKNIFSESDKIGILFMSISIALQLLGIKYFLTEMKGSFGELIVRTEGENQVLHPVDQLKKNFTTSKVPYLLILAAFSSLALAKVYAFHSGLEPFFYLGNPAFLALVLDIYNTLVSFFMLYLMATLLWMIISISYMLFKINNDSYNKFLKIKPIDPDRAGGLKHLKGLLLRFSIFYFLIVALAALTNFTSIGLSVFESVTIGLFWLIGALFFLYDWYALHRFIRGKIGDEVLILSEMLESKRAHLIDLLSKTGDMEKEDQINLLSNALDIVNKERDRIQQYKLKLIDARTIIIFAASSALSLITVLKASGEDGKFSAAIFVIDNVQPYIKDIVNYIYSFLPK